MGTIEVVDNFLTPDQHEFVLDYCEEASYYYGEVDRKGLPPTGMIHIIDPDRDIYELFRHKTEQYSEGELCEMYINCFAPSERPYFHTDGSDGITMLYYPQEKNGNLMMVEKHNSTLMVRFVELFRNRID